MPESAELITELAPHLRCLTHPGDAFTQPHLLSLPTFQTATLPQGMAEELAADLGFPDRDICTVFLEALFHQMALLGYEPIATDELNDLRAAAANNEPKRNQVKQFVGRTCRTPLFRAMVTDFDTEQPSIDCGVIKALGRMSADCESGHKANR